MPNRVMTQMVDYLSATACQIHDADSGDLQEIICITIRPDKTSFRPHNIGLLRGQAERLLSDLQMALHATDE